MTAYAFPPSSPESTAGDQIRRGDVRFGIIWANPDRLSAAPCFYGTRVPIQILFDYLEGGETIDSFLEGFPPITREHVRAVLELAHRRLAGGAAA